MRQKQRVGRYPQELRQRAVQRVRSGESVLAVSEDMGVHQSLIYRWRKQIEGTKRGPRGTPEDAYQALRKELQQAKQLLAEKALEVDFFKGALQKIEARRRRDGKAGEQAYLPRSGK